jgi:hypothetical protein
MKRSEMKNLFLFLIALLSIFSCQKKELNNVYEIPDNKSLEELFSLKNYNTQRKQKINDSILHISGTNGAFFLEGNFNTKLSEKTGLWTLTNKNDSKKIEIDYLVFEKNNVHRNQVIFSDKGIIDTLKSKFYHIEWKVENGVKIMKLNFYSPRNKEEKFMRADLNYFISNNGKKIKKSLMENNNGKYEIKIPLEYKKGDEIIGYFSEYISQSVKKEDSVYLANNTIYFYKKVE